MKIYDLQKKNKFDDCELTDLLSSGKVPFKIIYDGNIEKDGALPDPPEAFFHDGMENNTKLNDIILYKQHYRSI